MATARRIAREMQMLRVMWRVRGCIVAAHIAAVRTGRKRGDSPLCPPGDEGLYVCASEYARLGTE